MKCFKSSSSTTEIGGEQSFWKKLPQYSTIFNVLLIPILNKVKNIRTLIGKLIIFMGNTWFSTSKTEIVALKK